MQFAQASQPGFDPYSTDVGWFGAKLVKKVGKLAKKAAPYALAAVSPYHAAKGAYKNRKTIAKIAPAVLEAAKTAVRHTPYGMVAGAAIEAMKAGLQGKSLASIAEAAGRGAVPRYISAAVDLASDAVRGRNVIKSALNRAASAFVPGSDAEKGFNVARHILTGGNVSKLALAEARKRLGSEEAKRAFDTAVGTASQMATAVQSASPLPAAPRPRMPVMRGPGRVVARFMPVQSRMAQTLARRVPAISLSALRGRRETAGLEAGGATYLVEKGDSAWVIAKRLVGDGMRWKELVAANSTKKRSADGNFATLFAGERLTIPGTWQKTLAPKLTADVLSQARAIIKVWSESDGANQAGVTDYGDRAEDSSLVWGPRDRLMLASFIAWANQRLGLKLSPATDLTDGAADALRAWLARHVNETNTTPVQAPANTPNPTPAPVASDTAPEIVSVPAVATQAAPAAVPSDVLAMASAAQASGSVETMRTVASAIYARGYRDLSDKLNASADELEARQMGVPSPVTMPTMVVTGTAPAAVPAEKGDDLGMLFILGAGAAKLAGLF